jgi:cbb3-type cytochrome oxidase subunit 3
MTLTDALAFVRSWWMLAAMVVFLLICAWALWPGRESGLERHARIPLDDDR